METPIWSLEINNFLSVLLPFPESRLRPESQHQHGLCPVFIADWAIVFKPLTHYTLTTDKVQVPAHKLQVNSLRTKTLSILFCNLLYLVYRYITCLSVNYVPLIIWYFFKSYLNQCIIILYKIICIISIICVHSVFTLLMAAFVLISINY